MTDKQRLIVLWLLTVVGMILHFNYHVSSIFYGIDVTRPNATGEIPNTLVIIRSTFYHAPMIWVLTIMYAKKQWVKLALFILSLLYWLAHFMHFAEEVFKENRNLSQLSLLALVLIFASFLVYEHYHWKCKESLVSKG